MSSIAIMAAQAEDLGELFTLQRAAFVSMAQLYGELAILPLVETPEEMAADLAGCHVLKAVLGTRIVGTARARHDGDALLVGRMAVAPDMQGRGIGTRLLAAAEELAPPEVARYELFTGHLNVDNIRLYARHGYAETRRLWISDRITRVYMEKQASQVGSAARAAS